MISAPSEPQSRYLPNDRVYEHGFDPLKDRFLTQGAELREVFVQ